jgi:MoxR-like ATPase
VRNPKAGANMQRFEELKNYLHTNFVELDHAIRAILLGLTAKAHVFLLGPPGTAKSHLAEVLCDSLELKAFRFLFTDETKHKDIFGIQSIQALKEDKDVLITEGKLPVAEMAYLDEIWKANASVVNMLLWALRDGKFTNGGQTVKMPLVFAIACSNELPEDSTRRAIYDRLLIREEVKDIEMAENFRKVLERSDIPPPKVPTEEIEKLWKSADGVKVSNDVKEALTELREKIHDQGVRSSNRRWFDSVKVLRASAALEGRPETELQDLESLSSILWHQPEERVTVRQAILNITDPGLAKVFEYLDSAREEFEKVKQEQDRLNGSEMFQRASQAATEVAAIIGEAEKTARSKREKEAVESIRSIQANIMRNFLKLKL